LLIERRTIWLNTLTIGRNSEKTIKGLEEEFNLRNEEKITERRTLRKEDKIEERTI